MSTYTVKEGEDLLIIAEAHKVPSWEMIWYHPSNARLRAARSPFVLSPGDEINIPQVKNLERYCVTGKKHTFPLPKTEYKARLVIHLADPYDQPMAGIEYELTVEGKKFPGKTGKDGKIQLDVPFKATEGKLKIWYAGTGEDPEEYDVEIAKLLPVDSEEGLKARLANLGYLPEAQREDAEALKHALGWFQENSDLAVTGEANSKTLAKLLEVHGS